MPQLPQIVRERLKTSPPPGIHPDADVLTAFGERLLPESERAVVLDHLARCGDCREIIALALPVSEAADVAPLRNAQRGWFSRSALRWGMVAAGIVAAASVGIHQIRVHQRANVTVAHVTSRAQEQEQQQESDARIPIQAPQAQTAAPANSPREESAVKSPAAVVSNKPASAHETKDFLQPGRTGRAGSAEASAMVASGAAVGGPRRNPKMAMAEPPRDLPFAQGLRKSMSPATAKQAPVPAPSPEVPPSVSETVEVQGQSNQIATQSGSLSQEQSLQGRNAGEPQLSAERADVVERAKPPAAPSDTPTAAPASTPRWTISSSGSLQRSFDGGNTWQNVAVAAKPPVIGNVMTAESVARPQADKSFKKSRSREENKSQTPTISNPMFRAVAAAGLEVWAGGSGSMLYHSRDGGEQWTRVLPSAHGIVLTGDITTVEFSDRQHGTVSTSSSEVWTTGDGGQSWQKQ
jgi:hypothetical protein